MSARLTYTSGELGSETDAEFEARLAAARAVHGGEPRRTSSAGRAVDAGELFERRDPCGDDAVASRAHAAPPSVVDEAVAAAASATGSWRATPWAERCAKLRAVGDGIGERHLELAAVVSLETGKSRTESILEVQEAIDLIAAYADHMERNDGYVVPLASFVADERNTDVLRPYGVFAVIAPFNFPAALSIGMAASALIAGNTVVFKPSEETPWTGAILAEIIGAAGVPPGAFNLVHGGEATGRALVDAPVDGVAFTGSAAVGREIVRKMHDGPYAAPGADRDGRQEPGDRHRARRRRQGGRGGGARRLRPGGPEVQRLLARDRRRRRARRLRRPARRVGRAPAGRRPGRPREPSWGRWSTRPASRASRQRWPRRAARAVVVAGGGRPDRPGLFVEPTVVSGLPLGHPLERDELFLPFVTVTHVGSLDDALAEANAPAYGLTAGIFSEDPAELDRFLDEIQAGVVYVNRRAGATTGAWPGTQSFCGWKSSGTTGKGGLGPYYLTQFMREQSRTVVG